MSIRDYASRLLRLLKRFAEDTDPQEVLQKVLRERVIQVLPKEAKAFVRNREPQTVSAACSLAEQYFANDEKDLTSWDSRSSDDSQPYRKQGQWMEVANCILACFGRKLAILLRIIVDFQCWLKVAKQNYSA